MKTYKALISGDGFEPFWKEMEAEDESDAFIAFSQFASLQNASFTEFEEVG